MATGLNVSTYIEQFCRFYNNSKTMYDYYYGRVNDCDKLKCDIEHKLELGLYTDRNEMNRLNTMLRNCLKERRYYKDRVEELEPFVMLFVDDKNNRDNIAAMFRKCINQLSESLGKVRKMENYHTSRTYKPRILTDDLGVNLYDK